MDDADSHFSSLANMIDGLTANGVNELDVNSRKYCHNCERPITVCLCKNFPRTKLILKNNIKVWIFQHPAEEKRPLRTARILEKCLDEKHFQILKSRKFSIEKFPELKHVFRNENSYVFYPSANAITLREFTSSIDNRTNNNGSITINDNTSRIDNRFNLILLDGTWPQASGIYWSNPELRELKQIKIENDRVSEYTVRTQPRESFLSTLETVSIILSTIEHDKNIYEILVKPLRALCELQFEHGAKPHQSKEYLLFNGLYNKPISKRSLNKLTKNSKFYEEGKTPSKIFE